MLSVHRICEFYILALKGLRWQASFKIILNRKEFIVYLELLEKEIDLRIHYSKKFHFILVDEFQDTSTLQMDWLKLMMDRDDQNKIVHNCFMAVVSLDAIEKYKY